MRGDFRTFHSKKKSIDFTHTVHFGRFLGDDPLPGLQQRLAVRHVRLCAGGGEGRRGGGRQLLQLEEVQAHVGASEEPAAA